MRQAFAMLLTVMLFLSTNTSASDKVNSAPATTRLCRALSILEPGQRIPVAVTGILKGDYLYDPLEPACPEDVQPSTFVEFSSPLPPKAAAILARASRLMITVEGMLCGPEPIPASTDVVQPAMRVPVFFRQRYGFHGDYRTKLVVNTLQNFREVPDEVPWAGVRVRPQNTTSMPEVAMGALPSYPPHARRLGIQGTVVLEIEVNDGRVVNVQVVSSGDPFLDFAASENASTWVFHDDVSTRIESTFTYELERRTFPADDNPRIEARLPAYVRIVGPTLDW